MRQVTGCPTFPVCCVFKVRCTEFPNDNWNLLAVRNAFERLEQVGQIGFIVFAPAALAREAVVGIVRCIHCKEIRCISMYRQGNIPGIFRNSNLIDRNRIRTCTITRQHQQTLLVGRRTLRPNSLNKHCIQCIDITPGIAIVSRAIAPLADCAICFLPWFIHALKYEMLIIILERGRNLCPDIRKHLLRCFQCFICKL